MIDFEYRCIDASGKEQKGTISAVDPDDAKSRLKSMDLMVIGLTLKKSLSKKQYFQRKKVNETDIYNLSKELSVLLKSGITIDKAIEILIGSTSNNAFDEILKHILSDVKGGRKLSQAFEDTKKFNQIVIVTIRIGENVGDLRSAFENIAQYMHFQIQLKNEIRNAMAYPMFLILASAVTILVIFKLIIPRFFEIFDQNMETLPFVSRALFSISNFMDLTNLFLFLGVIGLIILFARLLNLRGVLRMFYSSLVYVPVFKKLIFYLELSRFSFSMHSMLKSGVEFINALKLSVEVIQNTFIRVSIERTINQIKEGKSIESAFSHISFLPPMMHVMLKVGEKSGNLKEIFFELYNVFDEKLKNLMKKALLLLEPLIITIMGIIVGIIVMSLMLTVMSVSNIKL